MITTIVNYICELSVFVEYKNVLYPMMNNKFISIYHIHQSQWTTF
jgi:hypothetical protein